MLKRSFFFQFFILSFFLTAYQVSINDAFAVYSEIICDTELEKIILYIHEQNSLLFIDTHPKKFFPLSTKRMEHFFISIEPINDFFYPQKWHETIFPYSINPIKTEINNCLKLPQSIDKEEIKNSDVILLTHPSYDYIKSFLTQLDEYIEDKGRKNKTLIFVKASLNKIISTEERKEIIAKEIKKDIEDTLKRDLSAKEIDFIIKNSNTEYGIVSILIHFLGKKNIVTIFNDINSPLICDFLYFLNINKIKAQKITIISPNPMSYLINTEYLLEKKEMPELYENTPSLSFFNFDINNITTENEGNTSIADLKKLRLIFFCLETISNYLDY